MVTNKELLQQKVQRINEKTKLDLRLSQTDNEGQCFLESNEKVLFDSMECYRSEDEMFEYLSGFEDAIDYFKKQEA